jgi:hypothetical protein
MFVPRLSAPLTKAIRTSEGILVWLVNLGLAAGALVDPTTLPPKEAAIVVSALTGLHVASRTLLKVTAVQQGVGIAPPVDEAALVEQLAGELAGKFGVRLPAHFVDEASLAKIVSEGVKAAGDPQAALHSVETQVVSDAEEFAAQPPAPSAPAAPLTTPADVASQTVAPAVPAPAGS